MIRTVKHKERVKNEHMKGGKWFHLKCAGLRKRPSETEEWICKKCEMVATL